MMSSQQASDPEKVGGIEAITYHVQRPGAFRDSQSHPLRQKLTLSICTVIILVLLNNVYSDYLEGSRKHERVAVDDNKGQSDDANLCLTPACIHASSELLYNLSPDYQSIDPCTDFEELVCGGWKDQHDLRPDQGDAFTGTIMAETSQMLLKHILEASYPEGSSHSDFSPAQLDEYLSSTDKANFEKLKAAYDACIDQNAIQKLGVDPLISALNDTTSTFYTNVNDKDGFLPTLLHLSKIGVTALVATGIGADDKDPDTVVVSVAAPYAIGLPAKEFYADEKVLKKYEEVASQVISALYPHPDFKADTFHSLIEFEKKLAAASPDAEDRDDVTKYYNPTPLTEANTIVTHIHLADLIGSLAPAGITVDRIILMAPDYMKTLNDILTQTPKEIIHMHFVWRQIQAYSAYVEADAVTPLKRLNNELQGKDPDSTPERWRTCVRHVDNGLGWILSRFFVEKAFSANAKAFGDQIVSDIKDQFIERLKVTEWMEKSVIELAIRKVHNIVQKIGYPDKSPNITDPGNLHKYYHDVDISSTAYFDNAISISRFDVKSEWSALGKPVDRNEWGMTVPTVNAYYSPSGNEIVFPAGIMQFPVFDVDVPQYLSYGAFGAVSGHELSHAFDSTGRHFDQNGNYTDWWTPKTVEGFKERAECFVKQYGKFTVEGSDGKPLHVNGRLTLGENIADAGGLSAAFKAWKKRANENPNQDLPGLDFFSQEQLFFVSYSNWWCGKSRKEAAINRIYTDPHAPKWARILGTMANSREFRDAFQCKEREPVCELW